MFSIESVDALGIALTSALAIIIVPFFIIRVEGKPLWKLPGMANFLASGGVVLFLYILVVLLRPERHEPHVAQMIRLVVAAGFGAIGWQHWRASRLWKAGVFTRRGAVGWQLWRASPTMSTAGELMVGIVFRISSLIFWVGVLGVLRIVADAGFG